MLGAVLNNKQFIESQIVDCVIVKHTVFRAELKASNLSLFQ